MLKLSKDEQKTARPKQNKTKTNKKHVELHGAAARGCKGTDEITMKATSSSARYGSEQRMPPKEKRGFLNELKVNESLEA